LKVHGSKNKDILAVSVDHDVYHAINDACTKHTNKSAMCNELLRQVLVANGMLEV
jgi:hypothetical protein